jgi:Tfp pilus assembly protein PilE
VELIIGAAVVYVLFKIVKHSFADAWLKSSAATVLSSLMRDMERNHSFSNKCPCFRSIDKSAEIIIQCGYEACPDAFNGKKGLRAHKVSLACYSLGVAATRAYLHGMADFQGLLLTLNTALKGIEANAASLPLNRIDHELIKTSQAILVDLAEKETNRESTPLEQEIDNMLGANSGAA